MITHIFLHTCTYTLSIPDGRGNGDQEEENPAA